MMKVLVNGIPLLSPLTGIGQYIRHLFSAMDRLALADVAVYYGLRVGKGIRVSTEETAAAVMRTNRVLQRLVPFPRTVRRGVERALFRYHTWGGSQKVIYHEPNYVPMPYKGPLVLTVCDMSCFDHPETHPAERVRLMQRDMPAAVERADHIVVISEDSGAALRRWLNVPPEKITVTYLAADARFAPASAQTLQGPLAELGLSPGGYVLCVGTLEPRKNLRTLFEAYAGLPQTLKKRFPLVVAGMSGWHTDELMKASQQLVSSGDLRLLGYVKDGLIPPLYAGCAAFCYPSKYEGFGLPALEAMASGVPVLTGNRTSLPEVVGDAGLMVDPDDVEGMREKLRLLLEDRSLAQRLATSGLQRAQSFSWERCAQETVAVYEKVLSQRGQA